MTQKADCSGSFGCNSPKKAPQGQDSDLCQPCPAGAGPPWRGLLRSWLQRVPAAGGAKALSPLHWQGPSPLPQRHADPWPAGGQSPRPAPVPPMAGASHPPGRALAFCIAGGTGLGRTAPRGRGKRGAFPDPARPKTLFPPGSVLGHLVERILFGRFLFRRCAECIITEPVRRIAVAPDMSGGLEPAPDSNAFETT